MTKKFKIILKENTKFFALSDLYWVFPIGCIQAILNVKNVIGSKLC
jgi:hypothetical protein